MTTWSPIAVLPNLSAGKPIEGGVIALAGVGDARIDAMCRDIPEFAELLCRFTDAFGVALNPYVLIASNVTLPSLSADALLSFRDLAAMSVIPHCRSLSTVYPNQGRIAYSTSFWIYPWTLSKDNKYLTTETPALSGIHVVEAFHGQSSPEIPVMQIDDMDVLLFEVLLTRWKQHYLGKRKRWKDRALFRSLNMAVQAASLPAGVGTNIFDLGRSISLWVSAFEILSHPGSAKADLFTVYPILEDVAFLDKRVGRRHYAAYIPQWKKGYNKKRQISEPRRPLPCWIYGKLYDARNRFLHGNRVSLRILSPRGTKTGLFWLGPSLYRLMLTGFLNLTVEAKLPYRLSAAYDADHALRFKWEAREAQHIAERALLRILG